MNIKWKNAKGKLTGTAKAAIIGGTVVVLAIASISGVAANNTPATAPSASTHDTATPTPSEAPVLETPTPTPTPAPKVADGKSLATAVPAGSVLKGSDYSGNYTLQFGQVNWDAGAAIKAANMFNEAAPAGQKYLLVPVTVTNTGTSEVSPGAIMLSLAFVTDDGRSFQPGTTVVVVPNDTLTGANLYAGTTITGDIAILIPADVNTGAFAIGGAFVRAN
jgi:hypothetical protein